LIAATVVAEVEPWAAAGPIAAGVEGPSAVGRRGRRFTPVGGRERAADGGRHEEDRNEDGDSSHGR